MLKIRGISNAENLLMGVNRFGHCLTMELRRGAAIHLKNATGLIPVASNNLLCLALVFLPLDYSQNDEQDENNEGYSYGRLEYLKGDRDF